MEDGDAATLERLGKRIRHLRRSRKWTQHRLAAEAKLHRNYLGGIERGERNPTVTNLARIAKALGVPLASLFEDDTPT